MTDNSNKERAIFGAGCFWGVESTFREVEGVSEVTSGYSGGTKPDPTYEEVCTGNTGHAEVVEVIFDPKIVSYDALLDKLWKNHDPTTMNRQGPDVGTQYRSAIFYTTDEQERLAEASMISLNESGKFMGEVVTEITKASEFYRAEEYHQRYFEKNGIEYCPV